MGYIKDLPTCKTITNNGKLVYTDDGVHSSTVKVKTLADIIKNSRNTSQSDFVDPSEIGGADSALWISDFSEAWENDYTNLNTYRTYSAQVKNKEFSPVTPLDRADKPQNYMFRYGESNQKEGSTLPSDMGIEMFQNVWHLCEDARRSKDGTLIDIDYSIYIKYLKAIGIMSRNLFSGYQNNLNYLFEDFTSAVQCNYLGGYGAFVRGPYTNDYYPYFKGNHWMRLGDVVPWIFKENRDVPRLQYLKDWVVMPYIEYKSSVGPSNYTHEVFDPPGQTETTNWVTVPGIAASASATLYILAPAVYYQFPEFKNYIVSNDSSYNPYPYWDDYESDYKKKDGIAWNRYICNLPEHVKEEWSESISDPMPGTVDCHNEFLYSTYYRYNGNGSVHIMIHGVGDYDNLDDRASYKDHIETGDPEYSGEFQFYDHNVIALSRFQFKMINGPAEIIDGKPFKPTENDWGHDYWKDGADYNPIPGLGTDQMGKLEPVFNKTYFPFNDIYYDDRYPNPYYSDIIARLSNIGLIDYNERNMIIGGFGAVTDQLTDFSMLTIGLDVFKIGGNVLNNFKFNGKNYEQFLYEYIMNIGDNMVTGFYIDGTDVTRRETSVHGPKFVRVLLDSSLRWYREGGYSFNPMLIGVKPEVAALYPPVSFVNGGIDSNGILQAEGIIHNVKVNGVDAIDSQTKEVDIDLTNAPSIKYCIFDGSDSTQGVATPVLTATTYDEDSNHHFHVFKHYKFNVTRYNLIGSNTTRDMIVDSGNTYFGPCMPGSVGPYFAGAMYSLEHSIAIFRVTIKSPIDATYTLFLIPSGETENSYRPFDPNDASYDPTYTDFDIVEVKAGVPTTLEVIKVMEDGDNTTRTAYIEHSIDPQTWGSGYSSWDPKPCFFRTTMFKHLINL